MPQAAGFTHAHPVRDDFFQSLPAHQHPAAVSVARIAGLVGALLLFALIAAALAALTLLGLATPALG